MKEDITMENLTKGEKMQKELVYKKKNVFEEASAEKIKAIFDHCLFAY